jgi:hypothetical protein
MKTMKINIKKKKHRLRCIKFIVESMKLIMGQDVVMEQV